MRVLGGFALCVLAAALWFVMRDVEREAPARAPRGADIPIAAAAPSPAAPAATKSEPKPESAPQPPANEQPPAADSRAFRGQVVDATTGRGVRSTVSAWRTEPVAEVSEEIATDAAGRFEFKAIEADEQLVVVARAHGYQPVRAVVSPTASWTEVHKLRIGIGGVLEGTVLDAKGTALRGCEVLLVRAGSTIHDESMSALDAIRLEQRLTASTQTDEQGRYRLRGVALGQVWVAAARLAAGGLTSRESRSKAVRFEVDAAREVRDIRFVDPANVTLRVWTENRTPVREAQVELWKDNTRHSPTTEAARKDGSWYWPKLSPGAYSLKVFPRDAPFEQTAVDLSSGESKDVQVTLDNAGVIAGQVIASDGAEPVHVSLIWAGEKTVFGRTDADGRFRLTGIGTKRGTLHVDGTFLVDAGLSTRDLEVRNLRPGRAGLRILMHPPPRLTGRLVGVPSNAVALAEIQSENSGAHSELELDEDGGFSIPGRIGEPFMLLIKTKGRAPARIDLHSMKAGEGRDLGTIEMTKGRDIEVLVTDAAGKPVKGARVRSGVRWLQWRATTNSRGIAKMKMAPEGAVHIAVAANGHPLHCFRIAANSETLRLSRPGTFAGYVAPGKDSYLAVRPHLPEERFDTDLDPLTQAPKRDAEGRFEIALQPGRYQIHASGLDKSRIIEIRAGETTTLDLRKR